MDREGVRELLHSLRNGPLWPEDDELVANLTVHDIVRIFEAKAKDNVEEQLKIIREKQRLQRVKANLLLQSRQRRESWQGKDSARRGSLQDQSLDSSTSATAVEDARHADCPRADSKPLGDSLPQHNTSVGSALIKSDDTSALSMDHGAESAEQTTSAVACDGAITAGDVPPAAFVPASQQLGVLGQSRPQMDPQQQPPSPADAKLSCADRARKQRALLRACVKNDAERVQELLAQGVDADTQCQDLCVTGLWAAAERGHADVVGALLAAGCRVNVSNRDGATALYVASQNGHTEVVRRLVTAGAAVDKAKPSGATPLLIAVQYGKDDVVQALCAARADPNVAMGNGVTPLITACLQGHGAVAMQLLGRGANARHQAVGKNCVNWAMDTEQHDTAEAVVEHVLLRRKVTGCFLAWKQFVHLQKMPPLQRSTEWDQGAAAASVSSPQAVPQGCVRDTFGPTLMEMPTGPPAEPQADPAAGLHDTVREWQSCVEEPLPVGQAMVRALDQGLVEVGPLRGGQFRKAIEREEQRAVEFLIERPVRLSSVYYGQQHPMNAMVPHRKTEKAWREFQTSLQSAEKELHNSLHFLNDSWLYTSIARAQHLSRSSIKQREQFWKQLLPQ